MLVAEVNVQASEEVPGNAAQAAAEPVFVPHDALSPAALRGVVESFVLREGTDYGERESGFETKVEQVLRQIERGEARITFDPESETINLVVA
jgi:uncharacterized protein YheU (UPF0270 family)